ncbi:MBL fold metallo-hydrolase [Jiella mangrovi]|uniref:MBL fold metallo-hydrolase n=1 Tax=Jiella mangrovi TaxID=2821407 RepID=A0ABS4BNA5_9HYPH|nr:MBL fold metallo-hydrolase [Jiella mangrovi]MBP0618136.1 MBL fold metallo-hydrolase [Jiella mangrovi]
MTKLSARIVPVTPFEQNCCILFDADEKVGVVIDPGGDADTIASAIGELGIAVKDIWLTHGHLDHAGGAMDLKAMIGATIVGPHEDDRMLLDSIEDQAKMFGAGPGMKNCTPDRWLSEGETVSFGSHNFEVYHTPGHAPGHVIFVNRALGFAHLGDVLFAGSIGRTDLPGGDHETLLRSIREKVLPLGDEVGFLCGHGPGSRIGDEKRTNPFLQ